MWTFGSRAVCYSSGEFLNVTPKLNETLAKDLRPGIALHQDSYEKLAMDLEQHMQGRSSREVIDLAQESTEESEEDFEQGIQGHLPRDVVDLARESIEKSGEDLEFGIQYCMSSDLVEWSSGR